VRNVLSEEKRKQVIALGPLGWRLRRIDKAPGVRRETAAGYLRAANITIRPPRRVQKDPAKPANAGEVTTDPAVRTQKTDQAISQMGSDSAPNVVARGIMKF
jgi:hypothetical protein